MGYLYIKLYLFHSICPNLLGILENPIFEGISFNVPLQKKRYTFPKLPFLIEILVKNEY